jgi:glycosyltransferase involved in cell wall biosynthesis
MRILQVANGFPPTALAGAESHTFALAKQLADSHTVRVFCREADLTRPEYTLIQDTVEGVPVTRVVHNLLDVMDYEALYRNRQIEQIFVDVLDQFRPDLVHFQHCVALSVGCIEQALLRRLPCVVTLHDYWYICPTTNLLRPDLALCPGTHHGPNCFDCLQFAPTTVTNISSLLGYSRWREMIPRPARLKVLKWLGRLRARTEKSGSSLVLKRAEDIRQLLARSSAIIAPSEYVKGRYVEFGLSPDLIRVIPLGMDVRQWTDVPRPARPANMIRFAYVGGLARHKGAETLVRAFRQAPGAAELYLFGFELPGDAFAVDLRKLAAPDARIRFMGPVPNKALPQALRSMDAFLMPALWHETFSFVTREAILAGLPVMASNMGVIPEIVHDGVNGRLLAPGNVDEWAACLRDLIKRPEQLESLRPRRGDLPVRSFEENARDHLALYREVWQT